MSAHDYSRSNARRTAPLAAPSAFGSSYDEAPQQQRSTTGTHYMPGDDSKIFNPKTGKYVKIEGNVGQQVIAEFGYPQQGGYSFQDLNDQLSRSFSDLYNSLTSTWNSLTGSYGTTAAPKKSSRKSSAKSLEETYEQEYPEYSEPKPRRRNNRRRN